MPGPAPLAVDVGTARFFEIDDALLARAPASLEALGTLGASAQELERLPPPQRGGLLRWIAGGGRLLVDTRPGEPVAGLPPEWEPGPDGRAHAGLGEVVATSGAMAAGRWTGLVEPTARGGFSDSHFESPGNQVGGSLAAESGLQFPKLGWLLVFLLAYVLVAGPLTFIVLRLRRREELAWVVVPLVALLFASGAYVAGRDVRVGRTSHGTVIASAPGGSTAYTFVGLISRRPQSARLRFPHDWSAVRPATSFGLGGPADVVAMTQDGPELHLPLNSGQFGIALGSGPVDAGTGLVVSTTVTGDDRLEGTVRNGTPFHLRQTAVIVGASGVSVGALGPGEQKSWQLEADDPAPNFQPVGAELWPGASGFIEMRGGIQRSFGGPAHSRGSPVNYALWRAIPTILDNELLPPG